MRLICYSTSGEPPKLVPAPLERAWMDRTGDGFAYRCLPLNIANAHGWMILNPTPFAAAWNGGMGLAAVALRATGAGSSMIASSHFGSGVLTFHVNGLFRTEPGYDLLVTGPFNQPKDAVQPLSGIVETDWAPFTFTMNWKFTRAFTKISFERDEPFCMIFPIKRGLVEETEPEIRSITTNEEIHIAYTAWAESRRSFNEELKLEGTRARAEKWQKDYFKGEPRFGESPSDHRTKLRAKPFAMIDELNPKNPESSIAEAEPNMPVKEDREPTSATRTSQQTLEHDSRDSATWGRVRRNERCPCGSGKKFKHCHGKDA
jgi:hypothetical protein